MKMKAKQVTLKNGTAVTLKSVNESEAELVLQFMKTVFSETENLSLTADEVAALDLNTEQEILLGYEKARGKIMLAAYLDEAIIATCSVQGVSDKAKYSHRAELGIAVKKEFWKQGIGSALLSTALDFADKVGYAQLELETAKDNVNAIILYNKFGFEAVGNIPRAQKTDGKYRDFIKFVKFMDTKDKE